MDVVEQERRGALAAAAGALEKLGVPYFLFGANAQNVWGDPRSTTDADFVFFLSDERFGEALTRLSDAGFSVQPERHHERIRVNRMTKLRFREFAVDFVLGETEFDRMAATRARKVEYLGTSIPVVSPEDLILYKLIAHRSRDLADIENVIRRQRDVLDRAHLRKWARWLARNTGMRRIVTTLGRMLRSFGKRR
ncbi:MAG: nucleotidyltransferase family protein [Planctomycetes bacterium]|nr:nucleotidyltransferase family protein [Planctomycetota bacterium]